LFSQQDVQVDSAENWKNCCKLTTNGIANGNAKMPMALKTQRNGKVKNSKANTWRMVSNTTTDKETAADRTVRHAYITT
jgi:hypothetical protein